MFKATAINNDMDSMHDECQEVLFLCMKLVIIVPADVLVPNGARPSAATILTTKLHI